MAMRARGRLLVTTALLAAGCMPMISRTRVPPGGIDNRVHKRLAARSSFAFTVAYHTDAPVMISAYYRGVRVSPDLESWDGFWVRQGQKTSIRMRARGDVQYFLTGSGWTVQPRGLESDILAQLEQLLSDVQLTYAGEFRGRYRFQFRPKMSLIDPLRQKDLSGVLEIDAHTGLPVRIYLADPDRSGEWEARFYRFDRRTGVVIPFVPVLRLELMPEQPLGVCRRWQITNRLRQRFSQLGCGYQFRWRRQMLEVLLDQNLSRSAVELLVSRGPVELWRGRRLVPGENPGGRVVQIGADAAQRVELLERLADSRQLRAELDTSIPLPPRLIVTGRFRHQEPSSYVLLTGERVLGVTELAQPLATEPVTVRLQFSDPGTVDLHRALKTLFSSPPLPVSFQLVGYERR